MRSATALASCVLVALVIACGGGDSPRRPPAEDTANAHRLAHEERRGQPHLARGAKVRLVARRPGAAVEVGLGTRPGDDRTTTPAGATAAVLREPDDERAGDYQVGVEFTSGPLAGRVGWVDRGDLERVPE